jgi:hypothetical protein
MNEEERELLAAEYVLGTLGGEERESFLQSLAADEDLQARVSAWEQRLFGLERGQPAISPPERLWQAVEAAIVRSDREAAPFTVIRADARDWRPLGPGVDWLPLYRAPGAGWQAFLLRMAPGALLPAHLHARAEECLLIEGDLRIGSETFSAGDYIVAPAGSRHPRMLSRGGAVAYLRAALDEVG